MPDELVETREARRIVALNWLIESRDRLGMEAGAALGISAVLLAIVLAFSYGMLITSGGSRRIPSDRLLIVRSDEGYRLVDDDDLVGDGRESGREAGDAHITHFKHSRRFFGPCAIVERSMTRVLIGLRQGHVMSDAQCASLLQSAPGLAPRFKPTTIAEIMRDRSDMIALHYEPGSWSIVWSGIFMNFIFWAYLAFVASCFCWFFSSLHRLCDPRRKRALRLAVGQCPQCHYDLRGITSQRCPECGDTLMVEQDSNA